MKKSKKKDKPVDHWINVNTSLPKVTKGDGCSVEVLTRGPGFELTATWDGRQWFGWDGNPISGVTDWTSEGVAQW